MRRDERKQPNRPTNNEPLRPLPRTPAASQKARMYAPCSADTSFLLKEYEPLSPFPNLLNDWNCSILRRERIYAKSWLGRSDSRCKWNSCVTSAYMSGRGDIMTRRPRRKHGPLYNGWPWLGPTIARTLISSSLRSRHGYVVRVRA